MANMDFSQFFTEVKNIPFTIFGHTFKVKNAGSNSVILTHARNNFSDFSKYYKVIQAKVENETATEEEIIEFNNKYLELYEIIKKTLKVILGPDQFKVLEEIDLTIDDYMTFYRIVNELVSGKTQEEIIEEIIKERESATEETTEEATEEVGE